MAAAYRRRLRYRRARNHLRARIVLGEVAVGEAQTGDGTAEASVVDLLNPEAGLDRQACEVRAHRTGVDLYGAGRQRGEAGFAPAARPDGADHRAVGEDAAHAGGAVEAGVAEELADHECPGLVGCKILGEGGGAQNAPAQNGENAQQHVPPQYRLEGYVNKIS